jgi:ABC-type lipoprotein export system ATPase subunit
MTYRLSEQERKELLQLTRENNKMLRTILTIVTHEHSSDFMNNIVANIIGNGIIPNKK